jgi:hypothetical protein
MIKQIEIYWNDLTDKAKKDILKELGETEETHNWDVIPMAIIDIETDAE